MSDPYTEFTAELHRMMLSSLGPDPQEGKVARSYIAPVPEYQSGGHVPGYPGYPQRARDVANREVKTVKEETPLPEGFYRSPHKIPKCTSPRDARGYPYLHATDTEPECPVHHETYFGKTTAWYAWYEARERYATAEDDTARKMAMDAMLGYVTEKNPPVDAQKIRRPAPVSKDQLVRAQLRRARVLLVVAWVLWFPAIALTVAGADPEGIVLNVLAGVFAVWSIEASRKARGVARS